MGTVQLPKDVARRYSIHPPRGSRGHWRAAGNLFSCMDGRCQLIDDWDAQMMFFLGKGLSRRLLMIVAATVARPRPLPVTIWIPTRTMLTRLSRA